MKRFWFRFCGEIESLYKESIIDCVNYLVRLLKFFCIFFALFVYVFLFLFFEINLNFWISFAVGVI